MATAHRSLLDRAVFVVHSNDRIGVVGRNGGGKTTLLMVIGAAAQNIPVPAHVTVSGHMSVAPGLRLGFLPQRATVGHFDGTVADYLDACAGDVARAYMAYQRLIAELERSTSDDLMKEYAEASERVTALDAWQYSARRAEVASGLGLSQEVLDRPLATVSGGQRTRAALAGVLLAKPTLLLLDEPTNHLDAEATSFLRAWLASLNSAVMLVSHDRDLLDDTTTSTLEIDEETGALNSYGGNYSFYLKQKDEEFIARVRAYEQQLAQRDALVASARRLAASARNFQTTSNNDYYRARGKKVARRATVQMGRIERELSALGEPVPPKRPRFDVPSTSMTRGAALAVHDLDVAAPDGVLLIQGLEMSLQSGDRLGIIGPNGSGKTSLLRTLVGEYPPLKGTVTWNPDVKWAYLPQDTPSPAAGTRVVDHIRQRVVISEADARALMGRVVFDDVGSQRIAEYSAGERRRMELAVFLTAQIDVLLLDEPTNHLDVITIEMLESALQDYPGTIIVVSHDARFLRGVGANHSLSIGRGQPPRLVETSGVFR